MNPQKMLKFVIKSIIKSSKFILNFLFTNKPKKKKTRLNFSDPKYSKNNKMFNHPRSKTEDAKNIKNDFNKALSVFKKDH